MDKETEMVSIRMPADHHAFLREYSEKNDIKVSQILRMLVRQFVEDHKKVT